MQDEEDRMGTVGTERRGKRKVGLVLASVVPFHSQLVLFYPFDPLSLRPHLTPNLSCLQVEISY